MIIPLPLIVSLLLAVIQATEFDYKIEYNRCGKDMSCFVRDSCQEVDGLPNTLILLDGEDKLLDKAKGCDVIIQIKPFTDSKFLVLMQFELASATEASELKIEQENSNGMQTLVECKDNNVFANTALFKEATGKMTFDNGKTFCWLTLESNEKIKDGFNKDGYDVKNPRFTYSTSDSVEYGSTGDKFWEKWTSNKACDFKEVTTSASSTDTYILSEVDLSRNEFKCGNKKLLVTFEGSTTEVEKVECKSSQFRWGKKRTDGSKELKMSCIEKRVCETCPVLPQGCTEQECTDPKEKFIEGCPIRECTDTKYMIGEEPKKLHEATKPVECKKKKGSNEVSWHLFEKDGEDPTPIDKLSCRPLYTCSANGTTFKCPEKLDKAKWICTAASVNANGTALNKCSDGAKFHEGDEEKLSYPTCNRETGEWQGIDPKKLLYCVKPVSPTQPQTGGSGSNVGLIVGGVLGTLVLLALVGGAVFWFVIRPKRLAAKKIAPPSKGLSSKKSGDGKSAEGASKSKKDKKASASDPAPDSSKKPSASGKDGSPDPATPADAGKPPPSTDIEKLADKNSDPKNPPTPAAGNEPPAPV